MDGQVKSCENCGNSTPNVGCWAEIEYEKECRENDFKDWRPRIFNESIRKVKDVSHGD